MFLLSTKYDSSWFWIVVPAVNQIWVIMRGILVFEICNCANIPHHWTNWGWKKQKQYVISSGFVVRHLFLPPVACARGKIWRGRFSSAHDNRRDQRRLQIRSDTLLTLMSVMLISRVWFIRFFEYRYYSFQHDVYTMIASEHVCVLYTSRKLTTLQ